MTYLLTLVVSVVVFGTVVLVHEAGHFFAARRFGIRVEEFSIGFGPALYSKVKNGTKLSLRLLPLGGYNMFSGTGSGASDAPLEGAPVYDKNKPLFPLTADGRVYSEASPWQRFFVIGAGATMNFVMGFLLLLVLIGSQNAVAGKTIYDFSENAASQASGLQAGDEILAVNGRHCFVVQDVFYELARTKNYTAALTVRRDGKTVTLPAVNFDTRTDETGNETMVVDFRVYGIARSARSVVKGAVNYFCYYARSILRSFVDLIAGRVGVNELSGPVGVVNIVSEAVSYGWRDVVSLAALLTINLGIFNLLPIPGLDGCKLLFLSWEGITNRPVPERIQAAINMAGMVLLLALMVFVTMQDVSKFF